MAPPVVIPTITGWGRGLWVYYRHYTDTTIHTAATAALAIFGILVVVDPWFAAIAVASYVVLPLVLYTLADESARGTDDRGLEAEASTRGSRTTESTTAGSGPGPTGGPDVSKSRPNAPVGNGDTDNDSDDGDTDSDSDGTDTDSDSDSDG